MNEQFTVNPWEVKGEIDYEKLVQEFGTRLITEDLLQRLEKIIGELHYFLRRKIFFSHRDLMWLFDEYEKGNKFYLYTGRGPSGKVHIGHLVPLMFTKWLQDKFKCDLWFQLTDDEKFLFKQELSLENTKSLAYDNILDVIAVGYDQKRTKIFVDTEYAGTMYKEALKVAKKINFSNVKSTFGFTDTANIGQIFFTSMQTVPAFLPSVLAGKNIPCLIPYVIDQDPHFRLTRDVLPKLGYYKPASIIGRFLPPLSGVSGKMSSSQAETAIFTTDTPKEVENKIKRYAFSGGKSTIDEHRKKGGNPDIDVSYQWLTFFEEDDKKLKRIYDDYKSGKLLTGELKQILIDKLTAFLKEHQIKREKAKKLVEKYVVRG